MQKTKTKDLREANRNIVNMFWALLIGQNVEYEHANLDVINDIIFVELI